MPNFVKVDSKPFHHETYMGPEQEEDEAQQAETLREKSMSIKLKVENTVRWRWTKDADDQDVSTPSSPVSPTPSTEYKTAETVEQPHNTVVGWYTKSAARQGALRH